MPMQKSLVTLLAAAALLGSPTLAYALDVKPNFNPSILIPDSAFADTRTFGGPEGIQRFLESKGSVLASTSPDFLVKLSEPTNAALKAKLDDPQPNLNRLRTAAEIIWDASQASGINPQVLLVTLNKEQSLITGTHSPERLQRALNNAMGFDCPDASGCGNLFPGFYYQLMGNVDTEGNRYLGAAKSLMKSFNTPTGRGPAIGNVPAKVGESVLLDNTLGDYVNVFLKQTVVMGNRATAALYRYTPHVFNGNYNFWRFYTEWFKYANGTLLTTADGSIYVIENGNRLRVPSFVATVRGLNLSSAMTASPTELAEYPEGGLYGPPDNTIVSIDGAFHVFENGVRHPASAFVLSQRKLDVAKSIPLSIADASLFPPGTQLTPTEGTVLRGQTIPDVYLVENGLLKKYSEFTFKQHRVAAKLQLIPDSEVAIYPKKGYVAPLDGTIIQDKAKTGTYLVSKQRRLPLTPELLKNRKVTAKDVTTLTSDEEIASIPLGPPATPAEGTYFLAGGPRELYLFKDGAKHPISAFVAKQRGITPDFTFEAAVASSWPEGIALAPRDGSLVKGDGASGKVYLIMNGQRQEIDAEVAKTRKLNLKTALVMPEADLLALAAGPYATPLENTYFTAGKNGAFSVFKKGVKQLITPFVAKQRGMTPDFAFATDAVATWPDGSAIPPRDGTLVQAQGSSTVYVVEKSMLRSLTTAAFKRKGYSTKNVKVVPATELAVWAKGEPITK